MINHRAMRVRFTTMTAVALSGALVLSACSPSAEYRYGDGFYSEQFTRGQVLDLQARGKVKSLAPFSVVKQSCLNFSENMTDQNMVIPAAQEGLRRWSGNAANGISAHEQTYDFATSVFLVPLGILRFTLGCRNLVVSENVLWVTP